MKRTDLARELSHEYQLDRLCGVEKVDRSDLKDIWFVVPPPPPRTLPAGLPSLILGRAQNALSRLPHLDSATDIDRMLSYLFVRREALQSSRMEGTWSTLSNILTPGEIYDAQDGHAERASVLGYAHALESEIEVISKKGMTATSIPMLCRLHRQIMAHDPCFRGKPGELRQPGKPGDVVWIGPLGRPEDSIYNPAPPRHVNRCLGELFDWMKDEELLELGDAGMGLALAVRMAIGHSHFEAIHPFSDGNGRVGRMLMTLQMAASGLMPLYLSGFIESEKVDYGRSLQIAQKKLKYGPIVEFICNAIVDSQHETERTRSAVLALPQSWRERSDFRDKSAALRILPHLISHPIFTAKDIGNILEISPPAAARAVTQLIEGRIVRQRSQGRWGRVFAAEEVIELLSRRFAEDPRIALARARELLKL